MRIVYDDTVCSSADYTYAARALERLAKQKRLTVLPMDDGEQRRALQAQAAVLERVARHLRTESGE